MSRNPIPIHQPHGRITIETIVEVARQMEGLDVAGKVKRCDELAVNQPEALGWVLLLSRQGVSMAVVDHALHLLLVISESISKTVHQPLRRITEDDLEKAVLKVQAMFRMLEGETKQEATRLTYLIIDAHPERNLLAYIVDHLNHRSKCDERPGDERVIFAMAVLLEVFLQVAGLAATADNENES